MVFDFRQIAGAEDSKQENFSAMCTCLLMRLHPDAKPVEGKGGDEGLDTFVGKFDGELQAFQHKFFLDKIGASQRGQIKASLDQVMRLHQVSEWVLMVPKDLTPAEIRWFEGLRDKYPSMQLDWWGKTKLQELLAANQDIASAFQPSKPMLLVVLGKEERVEELTPDILQQRIKSLAGEAAAGMLPQSMSSLFSAITGRPALRILVWGPGPSEDSLHAKRKDIRDRLCRLGHDAFFSEGAISDEKLQAGGLNVTIEEYLQARGVDYIVCLMSSPGSIGEVHDYAKKRELARKMMICVDERHRDGYSAQGALRIFEGLNGKLDWFRSPEDIEGCHVASRVLEQVQKTADAKHWELLLRSDGT